MTDEYTNKPYQRKPKGLPLLAGGLAAALSFLPACNSTEEKGNAADNKPATLQPSDYDTVSRIQPLELYRRILKEQDGLTDDSISQADAAIYAKNLDHLRVKLREDAPGLDEKVGEGDNAHTVEKGFKVYETVNQKWLDQYISTTERVFRPHFVIHYFGADGKPHATHPLTFKNNNGYLTGPELKALAAKKTTFLEGDSAVIVYGLDFPLEKLIARSGTKLPTLPVTERNTVRKEDWENMSVPVNPKEEVLPSLIATHGPLIDENRNEVIDGSQGTELVDGERHNGEAHRIFLSLETKHEHQLPPPENADDAENSNGKKTGPEDGQDKPAKPDESPTQTQPGSGTGKNNEAPGGEGQGAADKPPNADNTPDGQ